MKKQNRITAIIVSLCIVMSLFASMPVSAATINIGDYIQMGKYYGEPILWRCVDIDENGPLILSDKIICLKPFDAATSLNSTTGSHSRRGKVESNYWADSNIRSWLNSNESAGNVTWLCGNPPTEEMVVGGYNDYADEAGFLSDFTQNELSAMKSVTQKSIVSGTEISYGIYTTGTEVYQRKSGNPSVALANYDNAAAEYVTDTMFLLDVKQICEVYNNEDVLGIGYRIGYPTEQCVENSEYKYALKAGEKWNYWLRTPRCDRTNAARYIDTIGDVNSFNIKNGDLGVRPAFYLNLPSYVITSGTGTESDPYISDGTSGTITDEGHIPTEINKVTINGRGSAYGRFLVTKTDGTLAKNMTADYSIDGVSIGKVVTDKNGQASIKISNIENSKEYTIEFSGDGIKTSSDTLSVTVEPLHFNSSYEASITKGASVALGIGVGGSIGKIEAEAKAAEIGVSGSEEKSLEISQEYANDKNKLEITLKQNFDAALEAKAGLFAGATAGDASKVEISVGDMGGEGSYGRMMGVTFEDEDFRTDDTDDIKNLSKFMLGAMVESATSNVVTRHIIDKIDAPVNSYTSGSTASLAAGAHLGVVEFGIGGTEEEITFAGLDASSLWSESTTVNADSTIEYSSGVTADASINLLEVGVDSKGGDMEGGTSASLWKMGYADDISLSAKEDSDGYLSELGISLKKSKNNNITWYSTLEEQEETITYENDTAEKVAKKYEPLARFANGEKGFFSLPQLKNTAKTMIDSDETGKYLAQTEYKKGVDADLSASIQLFLEVGGKVGISGIEGYSFETENGIYENNNIYIQAKNDIRSDVEGKFIGVGDMVKLVKDEISSMLASMWDTVSGWLSDAGSAIVDAGNAVISGARNVFVSVTKPKKGIGTMAVLAVEDEFALFATSSVAATIGDPYIISVSDENGQVMTDFDKNPLTLTITYTQEQLEQAGVVDLECISILHWDNDKNVYVKAGGELDIENSTISLEITKPGQYILAVDNCSPAITQFMASDGGSDPKISAIVSDMSGISDFRFYIDSNMIADKDNFEDYYDFTTAKFKYQTEGLDAGEHTAIIYASDSFGNETEQSIVFNVSQDAPEIISVSALSSDINGGDTVTAEVTDKNLSGVFMNIQATNPFGEEMHISVEMSGNDGEYSAQLPQLETGSTINVWVSAYNTYGNSAKSEEMQGVVMNAEKMVITGFSDGIAEVVCSVADINATIYLAVYDTSGKLLQVQSRNASESLIFNEVEEGSVVKVFGWENGSVNYLYDNAVLKAD